mmetsp:Transcript_76018/g.143291  ORF Transcript_76018/g.143291 Transcript_76018/m.143291 type:complete len:284 (-) Transcript_76018:69-920(-)
MASGWTLGQSCCISGTAAIIAESVTIPFDTAKVRLQTQRTTSGVMPKYRGPLQTIATLVRESGLQAPFRGLVPGCHRMFIYTSIRLGLLDKMKTAARLQDGSLPLWREATAALCTSAAAITLANPSDVVKVRFQNTGGAQYSSAFRAYLQIASGEGVLGGLYKGYSVNLVRNCIISAIELTTYSKAKEGLLTFGLQDGPAVHVSAGLTAGFLATVCGSPADVVGTRMLAHQGKNMSVGEFCLKMLRQEGPLAFYKGFWPNFARIGSYNIVMWASYEKLKLLFA